MVTYSRRDSRYRSPLSRTPDQHAARDSSAWFRDTTHIVDETERALSMSLSSQQTTRMAAMVPRSRRSAHQYDSKGQVSIAEEKRTEHAPKSSPRFPFRSYTSPHSASQVGATLVLYVDTHGCVLMVCLSNQVITVAMMTARKIRVIVISYYVPYVSSCVTP